MAFKLISRPDPAPMEFYVTNNESVKYGQCLVFSSGRLTAAAPAGSVAAVALHDVTAGTDQKCKVILVTPEQIWEADYVGTPDSGFVVGCNSADLNPANTPTGAPAGLYLNAADVTGGPCSILAIDSTSKKAKVMFKNRQLA